MANAKGKKNFTFGASTVRMEALKVVAIDEKTTVTDILNDLIAEKLVAKGYSITPAKTVDEVVVKSKELENVTLTPNIGE